MKTNQEKFNGLKQLFETNYAEALLDGDVVFHNEKRPYSYLPQNFIQGFGEAINNYHLQYVVIIGVPDGNEEGPLEEKALLIRERILKDLNLKLGKLSQRDAGSADFCFYSAILVDMTTFFHVVICEKQNVQKALFHCVGSIPIFV